MELMESLQLSHQCNREILQLNYSDDQFTIEILSEKYLSRALSLLDTAYYPYEATCVATETAKNPKAVKELNTFYAEIARRFGVSIVALKKGTDDVVGVGFNILEEKPQPGEMQFDDWFKSQFMKESESIAHLELTCKKSWRLFELYNVNKIMESYVVAILPIYQKSGLGRSLVEATLNLFYTLSAREDGPELIASEFTSKTMHKFIDTIPGREWVDSEPFDSLEYKGVKLSEKIPQLKNGSIKLAVLRKR